MGNVTFNTDVQKDVNIAKNVNVDVEKSVTTTVDLQGSLASAEASADASLAAAPETSVLIEGKLGDGDNEFAGGTFRFSFDLAEPPEGNQFILNPEIEIVDVQGDVIVGTFRNPCPWRCITDPITGEIRCGFTCSFIAADEDGGESPAFITATFEFEFDSDAVSFVEGTLSLPEFGEDLPITEATLTLREDPFADLLAETETFAQVSEAGAFSFSDSLAALSASDAFSFL